MLEKYLNQLLFPGDKNNIFNQLCLQLNQKNSIKITNYWVKYLILIKTEITKYFFNLKIISLQ
jgi:hypothetical protein